ncbi:hypothetical protein Asp14428_34340 [Actinoplanes sp. NBRC 14428]|nr:hypothetical protein Asp14428_34340 [Actinoplanes sp. NBRC 14428]
MQVFVSWSGEHSGRLATLLRLWLPLVIPNIKPWVSDDDIAKGAPWRERLFAKLRDTEQGIVCITRENINEPWLNFEAGSLAKAVSERTNVWTVLLGVKKSEVTGPLASFQATAVQDREDFAKLVTALNEVTDDPHPPDRLQQVFDKWWPDLEAQIEQLPRPLPTDGEPVRTDRELLEEILTLVRTLPQAPSGLAASDALPLFPRVSAVLDDGQPARNIDQRLR